jgi:DNA-binding transcriptional regulator YhcF (GntR family)
MQLWFARRSEITIREQLVAQVILAILSHDLAPGERLPSTRELARRFHLHPNTVSAGYRQLEREQWVELRHGSGVYVRQQRPEVPSSSGLALDQLIFKLFRDARELGAPLSLVRVRLQQWLQLQPPDHFFLVEPDPDLRAIVAFEMEQALAFPVKSGALADCRHPHLLDTAIVVSLPSKTEAVRRVLPPGAELLTLQVRSVPASLAAWLPAPADVLVGVASRWPGFLKMARTILAAAGFQSDSLLFRDARKSNWHRGLNQTAAVVCDTFTRTALPAGCRAIPFPLLSESSLAELERCQQFISQPLKAL